MATCAFEMNLLVNEKARNDQYNRINGETVKIERSS